MEKLGEFYIAESLLSRFNCGCPVIGSTNTNRYCPSCLDEALDELLLFLRS